MSKADKIEKGMMTFAKVGAIGAVVLYFLGKRKKESTSGIGAAKRRIYKELSLAQQAGVDFTKPYEELDADEIEALERVSHDTGYTETYYKSLQKAYNAISGIGEAYDVVNEDGETVLTWIEDPDGMRTQTYRPSDDAERYAALREAHDIEDDMQWAKENAARELEEREARLAETRRRLKKSGRSSQMALFGVGYSGDPTYSQKQLDTYVNSNRITDVQVDMSDKSKPGKYYVLCGDERGGRGFYLAQSNLKLLYNYCRILGIPFYMCNEDIAGCGYSSAVESELYEIWREQLEYGDTDYDYDTWRSIFGDEYAKRDVLPYVSGVMGV